MSEIELSLSELAKAINSEHEQCMGAMREGLAHAIKAGEYLDQAKEQCQHGQWLPWLAENVTFSERTAQNYMRVYDRREELAEKAQHVADLTYRDAVLMLAEPKPEEPAGMIRMEEINLKLTELGQRLESADTLPELTAIAREAGTLANEAAEQRLRAERQLGQLMNVTQALKEIRDKKYYLPTHATFEDYCKDKLNIENVNELLGVYEDTFDSPIETAKLQAIITLRGYGVKLTPVGAEFPEHLSLEACKEVTKQLMLLERLAPKEGK